jgi:hypothetical protein
MQIYERHPVALGRRRRAPRPVGLVGGPVAVIGMGIIMFGPRKV